MGDALAPVSGEHLVARAHEVLAGLDLELVGPGGLGHEFGDVERICAERRDRLIEPMDFGRAHEIEPDPVRRNRAGMAVLDPQHDPLAGPGRRQPGIKIGRPGIGVVGAGQHRLLLAVGVEGIFDHIVPGGADHMHEQLAGERTQAEALPHLTAVDDDAAGRLAQLLPPLGQDLAGLIEQAQPQRRVLGAVAGPVIGRDDPAVMASGVAEEGEVGGDVERVQIAPGVGQHVVGQAQGVEAQDLGALGHEVADVLDRPLGVEGGDEDRGDIGCLELGDGLAYAPEHFFAQVVDVLYEDAGDLQRREVVEFGEGGGLGRRIVDGEAPGGAKPL